MNDSEPLILFALGDETFAMRVSEVERVVRAARIKPLPSAPAIVAGILNYHGDVVAIINSRKRFNIPERPLRLTDRFIIAGNENRVIGLICDEVEPVRQVNANLIKACAEIIPGIGFVDGVVNVDGAMVYLLTVDLILTGDEIQGLEEAMEEAGDE
jgi:purine-binding chemotaxis protein CheW